MSKFEQIFKKFMDADKAFKEKLVPINLNLKFEDFRDALIETNEIIALQAAQIKKLQNSLENTNNIFENVNNQRIAFGKELYSLKKSLWLTKAARFQSGFYHFDLEKDFWADRGNTEKENHFYEKREQCLRLQNACLERAKRFE